MYSQEEIQQAEILGKEAFAQSINVAVLDENLMKMIKPGSKVGTSLPLLKAWRSGWDKAHLDKEVAYGVLHPDDFLAW